MAMLERIMMVSMQCMEGRGMEIEIRRETLYWKRQLHMD